MVPFPCAAGRVARSLSAIRSAASTLMLRARLVLDDARLAHQHLDSVLDPPRFRVFWAASCALLRAVGNVLKNVDTKVSEERRAAIEAAWVRWETDRREHAIFWEFIKAERDLILKKYEIRIDMSEHGAVSRDLISGEATLETLGPEYYIPLTEGPFAGMDARELVRDALEWWDEQLAAIEAA